eukprot:11002455-Alexandrium_andersonii.AAC.1
MCSRKRLSQSSQNFWSGRQLCLSSTPRLVRPASCQHDGHAAKAPPGGPNAACGPKRPTSARPVSMRMRNGLPQLAQGRQQRSQLYVCSR